ncbi:MAG: transposase [Chitinivibrionia bacterium]|nr:transposase [Chitinivibrionia bacterium]
MCRFLDRLIVGAQRPVYLILHGHPMHKSRKVTRRVAMYKGRLKVFLLPPYGPELNPDEGVWREVKANRLGRAGIWGSADLKSKTLGALRHLACRPDKIRALFQTETTVYVA